MREQTGDLREKRLSVVLFGLTVASVYTTFGVVFGGGNPYVDVDVAADSALFSIALMSILLAHEMAHYVVALRHGFQLSMPYFIPAPIGVGTLGAIIRLRSLPRSRTALLEMGAAGPLAGAGVAFIVLAIGLPLTQPAEAVALAGSASDAVPLAVQFLESAPVRWVFGDVAIPGFLVSPNGGPVGLTIFHDPPIVRILGMLIQGGPPGRYDVLHPLALAGWFGCLLTAMNLLPIGQLDGGHILTALLPRHARRISRTLAGLLVAVGGMGVLASLLGGLLLPGNGFERIGVLAWPGWLVWGGLISLTGVWRGLDVPLSPPPTLRARRVALAACMVLILTFMPVPIEWEESPGLPPMSTDSVPLPESGR